MRGKYIYTVDDLKSGKKFEHPVVISNYPVDVHSNKKNCSTLQSYSDYQLPIEALMSADIDNLFVAGRCLSADFMSQGALRVQASCFSMGEGVAKYIVQDAVFLLILCHKGHCVFRQAVFLWAKALLNTLHLLSRSSV